MPDGHTRQSSGRPDLGIGMVRAALLGKAARSLPTSESVPAIVSADGVMEASRDIARSPLASDAPVGVVACPGAREAAAALIALDAPCARGMSAVAALPAAPEASAAWDEGLAGRLGLPVLFDPYGAVSGERVDATGGLLSIDGWGRLSADTSDPSRLGKRGMALVYAATVARCRDAAVDTGAFAGGRPGEFCPDPSVERAAELLSFGMWGLGEVAAWRDAGLLLDAVAGSLSDAGVRDDVLGLAARGDVVGVFSGLCRIWASSFGEFALPARTLAGMLSAGETGKLGRALGIDCRVGAFLDGAPLEDVLA